jgi:hypothetical protein
VSNLTDVARAETAAIHGAREPDRSAEQWADLANLERRLRLKAETDLASARRTIKSLRAEIRLLQAVRPADDSAS